MDMKGNLLGSKRPRFTPLIMLCLLLSSQGCINKENYHIYHKHLSTIFINADFEEEPTYLKTIFTA